VLLTSWGCTSSAATTGPGSYPFATQVASLTLPVTPSRSLPSIPSGTQLKANLIDSRTIPGGGSIDIPVSFEGSVYAAVEILSMASDLEASVGGVALHSQTMGNTTGWSTELSNPQDGTLHITNSGSSDATVQVAVSIQTDVYMTVKPSALDILKGGSLGVDVTLANASNTDDATAYLQGQSGQKTPIALTKVETGHWTGQFTADAAGRSTVYVQTSGTHPRYENASISVASGALSVANTVTEQTIDTDNDGLANYLQLTLDASATTAGTYSLQAELTDSAGRKVTSTGAEVSIVPGTQQIPIRFDGTTIYQSGLSGPYHLSFNLANVGTTPVVDEAWANNIGSTQAYDYRTFQH
jgi:hypothetical protein